MHTIHNIEQLLPAEDDIIEDIVGCFRCRLKESGAINTSLFMLSEVVDALNKQKVRCQLLCLYHLSLSSCVVWSSFFHSAALNFKIFL